MDEEKDNLIDNHRDDLQSENKTITTIINYDDEDICKNFVENETINGTSATIHRPFLEGHRDSIWMSMGINMTDEERRKRRMSRRRESLDAEQQLASLAPSTRVMFLLKEKNEMPALFTEMNELNRSGRMEEWRETARWVKFEEDVEEGGNRWSKPHVATLSLHSLFQLRSCLLNGVVLIDSLANSMAELTGHNSFDLMILRHPKKYR